MNQEKLLAALEGLINFIACPKPGQDERDKALRALIELRDEIRGGQ